MSAEYDCILHCCPGAQPDPEVLKAAGVRTVLVSADWAALEPEDGVFSSEALEALREVLIRLLAVGIEPVLSLFNGHDPFWFSYSGGWSEERLLRAPLRYAGRLTRETGHLVRFFLVFDCPNRQAFLPGKGSSAEKRLSGMASVYARSYRLIRDMQTDGGQTDVRIGFSLQQYVTRNSRGLRFLPSRYPVPLQKAPLSAFARGEFRFPLYNVLRVEAENRCDFFVLFPESPNSDPKALRFCRFLVEDELDTEVWLTEYNP